VQLPNKCLHISTAFASHFAAPHHIDPARSVGFSTKQRRTPAVTAARMDWVMSPSSGDALLCFVKRAVPAGSKCTNWYRQSSGCCGAGCLPVTGEGCTPGGWVSTEGRLSASTLTRVR
ncbi:hypothetical protein, partial [Escherichia coli]|uniref:hypothetical protein n=1 Tax=Escherichia coli TaxID=562 RepID=UPI0019D41F92